MTTSTLQPAIRDLLRFTRTHLRHHEALMRATGGHFNLFQILGIGHYEVKTHSPILAELLNPQGRHGQGDVFLRLFLERLGIDDPPFQASGTRVETERYIGPKTETKGGQIDIVIEDGVRRRVLIENKIYAVDQDNQLLRYHNYDDEAVLIYLTLDGKEASEYSAKRLDPRDYKRISYEKEIREWLMECRKEAACLPGVREMLSQYIALIEELTRQSTTMEMHEELIKEILSSKETLQSLYALRDATSVVEMRLIDQLDKDLERIASELNLKKDTPAKDLYQAYSLFSFTTEGLKKHRIRMGFQFSASSYKDLVFGFAKMSDKDECPIKDDLRTKFNQAFSQHHVWESSWWAAVAAYDDRYRNWTPNVFEAIRSGELAKDVKDKLVRLLAIANEVCGSASTTTVSGIDP